MLLELTFSFPSGRSTLMHTNHLNERRVQNCEMAITGAKWMIRAIFQQTQPYD
jgi:hypothetical protein